MSKHTPGPWEMAECGRDEAGELWVINHPVNRHEVEQVATCYSEANAALIVEAVNNYEAIKSQRDDLADALEETLEMIDELCGDVEPETMAIYVRARAALKRAER